MPTAPKHYLPNAKMSGVRPAKFDPVQHATGVRLTMHDSEGDEHVISASRESDLFGMVMEVRVEHTRIQRATLTLTRLYVAWPNGMKLWHDSADLEELT